VDAVVPVSEIGWRAHVAIRRAGGRARRLAALSESAYLTAADEIVWLGGPHCTLHARAVLAAAGSVESADLRLDIGAARVWQPPQPIITAESPAAIVAGCRALREAVAVLGGPDGFGALLAGRTPSFPLDRAVESARELARACANDDARAAAAAAEPLIGLGPGLTPAGDDYVGAAFFARALLHRAGAGEADGWDRARAYVSARARERTHPISATLLADLLAGQAHAPLHELACALAAAAPSATMLDAARRLTRIGHSSGWDMLAGFVGGVLGARLTAAVE
jgi:hypothetical protein